MSDVLISADCHLMEPPDLWTTRLPKAMRDRAVRLESTGDYMHFFRDGGREHITLAKYRSLDGPIEHDTILEERDQALAADGVWGEVVHSNLAFNGYSADNDLAFAHARVYNDYVVDVLGEHFDRHKPTAMLPLTDVADAVAEIERLAGLGIQAVMPPMSAPQRYCTTAYDPVWAAAQANGMVVFFHVGAGMAMDDESLARSTKGVALRESGIDMDLEIQTGPVHANRLRATIPATLDAQYLLADLVGGGILEHFPDLHFVITEFNAFWLAGLMASLDKAYTLGIGQDVSAPYAAQGTYDHSRAVDDQPLVLRRFHLNDKWPFPLRPSDYLRRQVHCTFQDDPTALALRYYTGIDCLLWGSDYPHHEATWPRTLEAVEAQFAGIPIADRAAITGGTLSKLLGFRPPAGR